MIINALHHFKTYNVIKGIYNYLYMNLLQSAIKCLMFSLIDIIIEYNAEKTYTPSL